jgi:hypothetical protein
LAGAKGSFIKIFDGNRKKGDENKIKLEMNE